VFIRTWRTLVDERRTSEYDLFASTRSLPMFRGHAGFAGVLFGRTGESCAVVTFWDSREAIDQLERSASYRETVADILATGFLVGDPSVEVLDLVAGELTARLVDDLVGAGPTPRAGVKPEP
jgi:heme-degrading monooxygenase HmoA